MIQKCLTFLKTPMSHDAIGAIIDYFFLAAGRLLAIPYSQLIVGFTPSLV